MAPLPDVQLTPDEEEEYRVTMRSLIHSEAGTPMMRKEHIEPFKRSVAASCLMARAQRFLTLSASNPESGRQACEAAAKACAVFPISIYFYDFACILKHVDKESDAKKMFAEFLARYETETLDAIEQVVMNQRDARGAVAHARREVGQ